jgi:hypothetical protein
MHNLRDDSCEVIGNVNPTTVRILVASTVVMDCDKYELVRVPSEFEDGVLNHERQVMLSPVACKFDEHWEPSDWLTLVVTPVEHTRPRRGARGDGGDSDEKLDGDCKRDSEARGGGGGQGHREVEDRDRPDGIGGDDADHKKDSDRDERRREDLGQREEHTLTQGVSGERDEDQKVSNWLKTITATGQPDMTRSGVGGSASFPESTVHGLQHGPPFDTSSSDDSDKPALFCPAKRRRVYTEEEKTAAAALQRLSDEDRSQKNGEGKMRILDKPMRKTSDF